MTDSPRIYVACLAAYNNGKLHGAWLDATNADDMRDGIAAMLRKSPEPNVTVDCPDCEIGRRGMGTVEGQSFEGYYECSTCDGNGKVPSSEEWSIHDHEGFGGLRVGENPDLEKLAELATCIDKHGEAFIAYASNVGTEHADSEGFEEAYQGEFRSEEEFAEQLAEDLGAVPRDATWPNNHIDWEAAARDLFCGDYYMIDGHVFRSN